MVLPLEFMRYAQNLLRMYLKAKIATLCRDFYTKLVLNYLRGFDKCTDTTGTQGFPNRLPVLINRDLLKVWFKFSLGRPHRVASIVAEGGLFTTFLADRHDFVLSQL